MMARHLSWKISSLFSTQSGQLNERTDCMQISESQTDRQSLERFGQEAVALLRDRNFQTLADRFGYAFRYGREPASAIEADLLASFSEEEEFPSNVASSMVVKYFNADAMQSTGLVAAVECILMSQTAPRSSYHLSLLGKVWSDTSHWKELTEFAENRFAMSAFDPKRTLLGGTA
jgi:hypothetical protein